MPKISVIAGDGIGIDVTTEALKVLNVVNQKHNLSLDIETLDYGAERYLRDGTTLPAGEMERFRNEVDAIYLGALGDPRIPDMRHGREILLAMRFELDLYINYRPVHCLSDRFCPLKDYGADDIRFSVFRENTEGVYVGMGGNFKKGTPDEVAINEDVNTRKGVERIIRAAFEYAVKNNRSKVTMVDKSNAMGFAHGLWRRVFDLVGEEYPQLDKQHLFVDAAVMLMVRDPRNFDVVVTSNLFGDIITDLGAELQGGMGMAGSANINPNGVSLFEPVHGSAPPLAGKNKANPLAAIVTAQMMLSHLGFHGPANEIDAAIKKAVAENKLTEEMGGSLGTAEVGDFIATCLS